MGMLGTDSGTQRLAAPIAPSLDSLLVRMRRVWMLEHSLRGALLVGAGAVTVCLLCLVLNRLFGLPLVSLAAVGAAGLAALGTVAFGARLRVPGRFALARHVDQRLGTEDLFASALEFGARPERFGWLGALACERAGHQAPRFRLRPQWSLGPSRQWAGMGTAAGALAALYLVVTGAQRVMAPGAKQPETTRAPVIQTAVSRGTAERSAGVQDTDAARAGLQEVSPAEEPVEPRADTVRITSEMIDRYLEQMPAEQEIDLDGVTPIRWDESEVRAKKGPQDRDYQEKIDPVKLDAEMLKDLESAKKTEDTDAEKKGGVDVAVIGKEDAGKKAEGDSGGKNKEGSLADAVSKDPRGRPTRLARPPPRRGLSIRSAVRTNSKQTGDIRPMGLLDFLTAMQREQAEAGDQAPGRALPSAEAGGEPRSIASDAVPDVAAGTASRYFSLLRDADR